MLLVLERLRDKKREVKIFEVVKEIAWRMVYANYDVYPNLIYNNYF